MITADAIAELAKTRVKYIIEEQGQEHQPIALMVTPRGIEVALIVVPSNAKDRFKPIFTLLLERAGASAYVFVSEGWKTSSARPLEENIRVTDLPLDDRVEIVSVLFCERGHTPQVWEAVIDTLPTGKKLREWMLGAGKISGRMVVTEW